MERSPKVDKGEIKTNKTKRGWEEPALVVSKERTPYKAIMEPETTVDGQREARKERGVNRKPEVG